MKTFPSLLAPLLLPLPVLAQGSPATAIVPVREAPAPSRFAPIGGLDRSVVEPFLFFDEPGDGAIWVRGETYKAKFDPEGATFIPFLGSHAPRNFPVRFALASVSRGGVPLPVAELVAPRRDGNRIVFDRGGVEERYECSPEAIEQVFVVDGVAGTGDLVVRMEVETDLPYAGISGGSLVFSAEGFGEVRYGGAVAFDESGASVGATRSWDGSEIELRVPGAFVAAAAGAITIDPLISVFCVNCTPSDNFSPDAAYDESTGRFLVVFVEPFSVVDHDVVSIELDAGGTFVPGSWAYIDSSIANWQQPTVANNNATNRHLVVAVSVGTPSGLFLPSQLMGRLRNAGSTSMLPPFPITPTPSPTTAAVYPEVGGDPSPVGASLFCVVWIVVSLTSSTALEYRMVDPNGGTSPPTTIAVTSCVGQVPSRHSIASSNGGYRWTIVWPGAAPGTGCASGYGLWGRQVDWSGNMVGAFFPVDSWPPNVIPTYPTVSSPDGSGRVLLAWRHLLPSGWATIAGRMFEDGVPVTPTTDLLSLAGAGITGLDHERPSAESDGCGFTVAFLEEGVGGIPPDLYLASFHYSPAGEIGLTEPTVTGLAGGPWVEGPPRIVSKWSGGGTGPRHLMVWESEIPPAPSDISGAIFDSLPSTCLPNGVACLLFSADFEGTGLAPYSETGSGPLPVPTLWHAESLCDVGVPIPTSMGTKAAAYNLGDAGTYNYNTGGANSGSLQSPFIAASVGAASASLFLTFDYMRETEGGATFDQSFVEVRPAGGAWVLASQIVDQQPCGTPAHVSVAVPLSGGNWQHRFRFSTGDAVANGFRGWYVDNVEAYQIAASCGSFTGDPTGCGGPVLTASGAPLIGGTVTYTLSGTTGVPVMWVGDPTSVPLCPPSPCTLGATLGILFQTTNLGGTIPPQPSLIGGTFSVQGGDAFGGGGCGAATFGVPFAVSQTIQTTIG